MSKHLDTADIKTDECISVEKQFTFGALIFRSIVDEEEIEETREGLITGVTGETTIAGIGAEAEEDDENEGERQ